MSTPKPVPAPQDTRELLNATNISDTAFWDAPRAFNASADETGATIAALATESDAVSRTARSIRENGSER